MTTEERLDRIEQATDTLDGRIDGVGRAAYAIAVALIDADARFRPLIVKALRAAEKDAIKKNAHAEAIVMLRSWLAVFDPQKGKPAQGPDKPR